jgi:NitT/TauT family transport system substrate-binding protein
MKKILSAVCCLALAVIISACGKNAEKKYKYGEVEIPTLNGAVCTAAAYIAYEKGFYEEEGVKVKLTSSLSLDAQRAGLATGKIPIIHGDFQFFPAINNGIEANLIGGLHQGCIKVLLPQGSKIKSAADLKGKTIGVDEIGGTPMSVVSVILGNAGLNPQTDVSWKPFPNDQLIVAAQKGEVDAVAAWDPFATILERRGFIVFSDIAEDPLFAGKFCCFLFASSKTVKENYELIYALRRAYYKGAEWVGNNPKEAAKILIEKKYIGTDDVDLTAQLLEHYKYGNHKHGYTPQQVKSDAVYFAKELTKTGYLPKDLDAQKFIDGIYADMEEAKGGHAGETH